MGVLTDTERSIPADSGFDFSGMMSSAGDMFKSASPYLSAAAPILGGLLGNSSANAGAQQKAAAAAQALAQLNSVGLPPDLSKALVLQHFQQQGTLTPELMQNINLQSSQVAQIQEDPSLKSAQMEALGTLGQVSRGGLQAGDRAAYNELRQKTQQDAEANRQSILQRMLSQGQGSSGNALIAQLQAGQSAEDQASAQGDRLAASASQNALQALNQRAQLAGNVRGQDFSANQAKAQALDDRNRFLANNSMAVQQSNINARNNAQASNLQAKQNISNANVGMTNDETQRQNQAKQDYWNNQLRLATTKANAINSQGSVLADNSQKQADRYSKLGSSVGDAFGALSNYGKKA
jgi:hypothetical protein